MKGHARTSDKRKYPLRTIVERDIISRWSGSIPVFVNKLECGHLVRPTKDLYGEIHSDKQRCRACFIIGNET